MCLPIIHSGICTLPFKTLWGGKIYLHSLEIINPKTQTTVEFGSPDDDADPFNSGARSSNNPEEKAQISKYFTMSNSKARYEYDFGDSWTHTIKLEKILPAVIGEKYPKCIAGKMACPPEDCGGVWGYYHYLSVLKDPKHEDYEEMSEWMDEDFDPEKFDPIQVVFSDPKKRVRLDF